MIFPALISIVRQKLKLKMCVFLFFIFYFLFFIFLFFYFYLLIFLILIFYFDFSDHLRIQDYEPSEATIKNFSEKFTRFGVIDLRIELKRSEERFVNIKVAKLHCFVVGMIPSSFLSFAMFLIEN